MAFAVNDIQSTPNPNALKFVLNRSIAEHPCSFFNAEAASSHPIASRLFGVAGVASLLLLGDFVTVNKEPKVSWKAITPKVREILQTSG